MPIYRIQPIEQPGDPSLVTPIAIGQIYKNTTTDELWIANSLTEGGFIKIGTGEAPPLAIVNSSTTVFWDFNGGLGQDETGTSGTEQAGNIDLTQFNGVAGGNTSLQQANFLDDGVYRIVGDINTYFEANQIFIPGTGTFTLDIVFRTGSSLGGGSAHLFCHQVGSSTANDAGIFFSYSSGTSGHVIVTQSGGGLVLSQTGLGITSPNTWYHFSLMRDSSNNFRCAVSPGNIEDSSSFSSSQVFSVNSSANITPIRNAMIGARNNNGIADSFKLSIVSWVRISNDAIYE
jgi:hypothetical protein